MGEGTAIWQSSTNQEAWIKSPHLFYWRKKILHKPWHWIYSLQKCQLGNLFCLSHPESSVGCCSAMAILVKWYSIECHEDVSWCKISVEGEISYLQVSMWRAREWQLKTLKWYSKTSQEESAFSNQVGGIKMVVMLEINSKKRKEKRKEMTDWTGIQEWIFVSWRLNRC